MSFKDELRRIMRAPHDQASTQESVKCELAISEIGGTWRDKLREAAGQSDSPRMVEILRLPSACVHDDGGSVSLTCEIHQLFADKIAKEGLEVEVSKVTPRFDDYTYDNYFLTVKLPD